MEIGRAALGSFWAPVAAWTVLAGGVGWAIRRRSSVHPLMRYRTSQALLFALPVALLVAWLAPVGRLAMPVALEVGPSPTVALRSGVVDARPTPTPPRVRLEPVPLAVGFVSLVAMLAGGVGFVGIALRLRTLHRLTARAQVVTDAGARRVLARLRDRLGVRRAVVLLEGPEGSVPITFGWRRPVIVVPASLVERPDDLRMTLVHELVHVARGDFAWAVAEGLTRALFAFHPLVRTLARDRERHREASCDLDVLATQETAPAAYAGLLLALGTRKSPPYGMAAGLATPRSQLRERIETMKSFETTGSSPRALTAIGAVALLAATALLGACFSFNESVPERVEAEVAEAPAGAATYDPVGETLGRLDSQITYLETELNHLQSTFDERGFSLRDRTRSQILREMYEERVRQYEFYKMGQVVPSGLR